MSRAYYVVWRGDAWGIKLEQGKYIETGFDTQQKAVKRARQLARQPGTAGSKVTVNAKAGYTRRHIKNP